MTSFDARLRLIGHAGFPLGVEIDLSNERMIVSSGNSKIADWSLRRIDITEHPDGFHISAEGEDILLNVIDSERFAVELGLESRNKPDHRSG